MPRDERAVPLAADVSRSMDRAFLGAGFAFRPVSWLPSPRCWAQSCLTRIRRQRQTLPGSQRSAPRRSPCPLLWTSSAI